MSLGMMQPLQTGQSALRNQWQDNYNDLANLNEINKLGDKDADAALRKVAEQFESMFVSMMLKSMRDANAVLEDDNEMNSFALKMHRDMSDQQLVLNLSQGRGIGLAESFYQQMKQNYGGALGIPDTSKVSKNSDAMASPVNQLKQRLAQSADTASAPDNLSENQLVATAPPTAFENQAEFVSTVLPLAEKSAAALGVDPKLLVAQAALETGWGKYVLQDADGNSTYNLFNIKADERWSGTSAAVSTLEYRDGIAQRERASFRQYRSFEESFSDYAQFILGSERYQAAVENAADPAAYAEGLQHAGYATDPAYAEKIKRIFFSDNLQAANTTSADEKPPALAMNTARSGGEL